MPGKNATAPANAKWETSIASGSTPANMPQRMGRAATPMPQSRPAAVSDSIGNADAWTPEEALLTRPLTSAVVAHDTRPGGTRLGSRIIFFAFSKQSPEAAKVSSVRSNVTSRVLGPNHIASLNQAYHSQREGALFSPSNDTEASWRAPGVGWASRFGGCVAKIGASPMSCCGRWVGPTAIGRALSSSSLS